MTMQYDHAYVDAWRAKAVTKIDELIIGKNYYGHHTDAFNLYALMTWAEMYDFNGEHSLAAKSDNSKTEWMIYENEYNQFSHASLTDNNIGASYNPWLLFDDKELCDEYYAGLNVTWSKSDYDFSSDYDDY